MLRCREAPLSGRRLELGSSAQERCRPAEFCLEIPRGLAATPASCPSQTWQTVDLPKGVNPGTEPGCVDPTFAEQWDPSLLGLQGRDSTPGLGGRRGSSRLCFSFRSQLAGAPLRCSGFAVLCGCRRAAPGWVLCYLWASSTVFLDFCLRTSSRWCASGRCVLLISETLFCEYQAGT